MGPKEAIENLWKTGFFEKIKSLKEIEEEISKRWKTYPSNLLMTLKLKSVKKFLMKKKKGWIQRYPPKKANEIIVHCFEAGKPRTSRINFREILKGLTGEIKVCDPYLTEDSLDALENMKKAKIKFLTRSSRNNIKVSQQDLVDFKTENPNVAIKGFRFDYLHDRYIISENRIYLLGHGLSVRKKESFIIELSENIAKDLIQSLSTTFNLRWRRQDNIILI